MKKHKAVRMDVIYPEYKETKPKENKLEYETSKKKNKSAETYQAAYK